MLLQTCMCVCVLSWRKLDYKVSFSFFILTAPTTLHIQLQCFLKLYLIILGRDFFQISGEKKSFLKCQVNRGCLKNCSFFGMYTRIVFQIKCGIGAGSCAARWSFPMLSNIWRPRGQYQGAEWEQWVCGASFFEICYWSFKYFKIFSNRFISLKDCKWISESQNGKETNWNSAI